MLGDGQLDEIIGKLCSISQINLLSPFEQMAFKEGMRGDGDGAKSFAAALFEFIRTGPEPRAFRRLVSALSDLPTRIGGARIATWPVLTLFPYLADPGRFKFLKPGPIRACADRLRFNLSYDSALQWETYERFMTFLSGCVRSVREISAMCSRLCG